MRALRLVASVIAAGIVGFIPTGSAVAASQPVANQGLYLTPLRQYITVNAGQSQNGAITVANYTNKPITVSLTAEQFSVTNYTYDYEFKPAGPDNWIRLGVTEFQLQPFKNKQVAYALNAPAGATPGGHYYTLIASTTIGSGTAQTRVQAASILYVTVNGPLTYTSSMRRSSLPWIAFGRTIPYWFEVTNSGNTHFFAYTWGQLYGWSAAPPESLVGHILLPGTTRIIQGSIAAPILPGIYKATYGYKTDAGAEIVRSSYVLYVPPWSLFIPLGVGIIVFALVRRRRAH